LLRRGGIPDTYLADTIPLIVPSKGWMEDPSRMAPLHPLMDDYWKDKVADLAKIEVPAYILASYSTKVHSSGSFRGFRMIASDKKWSVYAKLDTTSR
jgi:predicted acyl esterase